MEMKQLDVEALRVALSASGADLDNVRLLHVAPSDSDVMCLVHDRAGWSTFYQERGGLFSPLNHQTEEEACESMFQWVTGQTTAEQETARRMGRRRNLKI
jgi:hypothetical protein